LSGIKYIAEDQKGNENGDEWKKVDQLVELIALYDKSDPSNKEDYNLANINILSLLRTSTFYRDPAAERTNSKTNTARRASLCSESRDYNSQRTNP
jgi:hypothetical protein